jgi:hypothetical protein
VSPGQLERSLLVRWRDKFRGLKLKLVVDLIPQETIAIDRDQLVFGVGLEYAGPSKKLFAGGALHHEEPVALQGNLRGLGGGLNCPLSELRRNFGDLGTQSGLPGIGTAGSGGRCRS